MASQQAPKCLTDGCECEAAKNEYYPNSEGGEFWTLCEKCYEEDQEEEDDDRPFCEDCRGYTCGGLGAYEPVCCCDSDEESDEQQEQWTITTNFCMDCRGFTCGVETPKRRVCRCGESEEENKPTIFEKLALPTPEEFELLPPDEQRLILIKTTGVFANAKEAVAKANAREARAKANVVVVKAKKTIKLKLKKKKPIKLKLKLKKEC
tara:strand:+ start:177 stop:797 length:621 start_codon:yes stop_codon:yes gene_type:complete